MAKKIDYWEIEGNAYAKCIRLAKKAMQIDACLVGKNWYTDAYTAVKNIAQATGHDPVTVAGVVSALSPRNKWERNVIDALNIINAHRMGKGIESASVCTFNANKQKAWAILDGKLSPIPNITTSPKTHSFVQNILGHSGFVTVDVWHCRLLTGKSAPGSAWMYRAIEQGTSRAAKRLKMEPSELQAILWVYARDILGKDKATKEGLK